jgi:ribonuclease HI
LIIFFIVSILTIGSIKLKISVYVDGSGGSNGGFGFFVKETGESFYEKKPDITNNQAEYLAIISALKKFVDTDNEIIIYSDSKNTVNQLNHEFAINNEKLRDLARESWLIIGKFSNLSIVWISRKENLAGKMLGS